MDEFGDRREDRLILHYRSHQRGEFFAPLVKGIIQEAAKIYFDSEVEFEPLTSSSSSTSAPTIINHTTMMTSQDTTVRKSTSIEEDNKERMAVAVCSSAVAKDGEELAVVVQQATSLVEHQQQGEEAPQNVPTYLPSSARGLRAMMITTTNTKGKRTTTSWRLTGIRAAPALPSSSTGNTSPKGVNSHTVLLSSCVMSPNSQGPPLSSPDMMILTPPSVTSDEDEDHRSNVTAGAMTAAMRREQQDIRLVRMRTQAGAPSFSSSDASSSSGVCPSHQQHRNPHDSSTITGDETTASIAATQKEGTPVDHAGRKNEEEARGRTKGDGIGDDTLLPARKIICIWCVQKIGP